MNWNSIPRWRAVRTTGGERPEEHTGRWRSIGSSFHDVLSPQKLGEIDRARMQYGPKSIHELVRPVLLQIPGESRTLLALRKWGHGVRYHKCEASDGPFRPWQPDTIFQALVEGDRPNSLRRATVGAGA